MTALNTAIASAGTILLGVGAASIQSGNIESGALEVILGIVCYLVYEIIPSSR